MNPTVVLFITTAMECGIGYQYLHNVLTNAAEIDPETRKNYNSYLELLSQRQGGIPELTTGRVLS